MGLDIDQLIPPEAVADAQREAAEDFEVWPENWDAVEIFRACDTQWNVLLGLGGLYYEGLDYERVAVVARDWMGLPLTRDLLARIRVLENEGKKILNR